jgi:predicted membrane chloride channel (bestrophin family)
MTRLRTSIVCLALAGAVTGGAAFAPAPVAGAGSPPAVGAGSTTAMLSSSADEDPLFEQRRSYIETSRQYRRTRYGVDDWLKHRSPDRFFKNLANILSSGIYRGIVKEVLTVTSIASFIWAWNTFFGEGFTDLGGTHVDPILNLPLLSLPLTPFTLASPSLGLLLVFRTNASYGRWDEARKCWGLTINNSRNIARMATAWSSEAIEPNEEIRAQKLEHLADCIWAFPRSLARHMESPFTSEADYVADLRERLSPEHADGLIASAHRPNRALFDLANAVNDLPMHALRRNEIDKSIVVLGDQLGGSERLFSSPVPIFYTRHTARYLTAWLTLLPFALYEPFGSTYNHLGMVPAVTVLSLFLFGIEELAIQLEEPFSILPMLGYSGTIGTNAQEIVRWHFEEDTP